MSKKLKLTKLELETKDGKKVELSLEEARELHEQLHELFGSKTTIIPGAPIIIERDRWWPPRPYYTSTWRTDNTTQIKSPNLTVSYYCEAAAPE